MNCDSAQEQLPFLDDGSLDAATEQSVRRHLLKCADCREEYIAMKRFLNVVGDAVRDFEPETVPGYLGIVRNKIRRSKIEQLIFKKIVPVAAAAMVCIGLALYSYWDFGTTKQTIETVDASAVVNEVQYSDYLSMYQLNDYDLKSIMPLDPESEDRMIIGNLLSNAVVNVTAEDVLQLLDDDELNIVLASSAR